MSEGPANPYEAPRAPDGPSPSTAGPGVARSFLIIIGAALGFGAIGAALGLTLGRVAPAYYRGVFQGGDQPDFDPVQVGLGLGLSQGLICGVLAGIAVVLAAAWRAGRGR